MHGLGRGHDHALGQEVGPPALLEDRLRRAFASLEAAADAGHLQAYGVATWSGLRALPGERDHLSLERLVRCAHDVAGDRHRLRAVQLPISLGGPEALVRRDQLVQGEAVSALQAAARLGLTVFAAGPLLQGRLARTGLPSGVVAQGPASHLSAAALALHFARSVPGVATALVGTSDRRHVVENAGLLRLDKASRAWVDEAARVPVGARLP
jgi:aryl-alcohol dehydrogenase-like predicted oxidoreductase